MEVSSWSVSYTHLDVYKRQLYDSSLVAEMRQYDASIISAMDRGECYGYRYAEVTEELYDTVLKKDTTYHLLGNFNYEVNKEILLEDMKKRGIEYFVRNREWFSEEYIQSLGFEYIGETEHYKVYKCNL